LNKYKKFNILFISISFILVISLITVNYVIDPYQQYRKTNFYLFNTENPRYLNAGLVKNYDYDSLIIGSSMMANFNVSDVEKILLFDKAIKPLTFGGFISEEVDTINTALASKNVKNILFGLDIYSFSKYNISSKNNKRFPLYLYDNSLLNDFTYLLSLKILKKSFNILSNDFNESKVTNQLNELYDWQKEYNAFFTGKEVVENYENFLKSDRNLLPIYNLDILKSNFDNILLPVIKSNKKINFIFFFPPYSIYEYKLMDKEGYLLNNIKFKNFVMNRLKKFKHVSLFDFQVANEITMNKFNYKDTTHYHKRINYWILEQIRDNKFKKVQSNVQDLDFINDVRLFQ